MSDVLNRETSPAGSIDDTVQVRAEEFQRIVDEAVSESLTGPIFLERLKAAGATPDEAQDYISQFSQRRKEREAAGTTNAEGALPGQADSNMPSPVDVATSIAWALLRAKVDHLQSPSSGTTRTNGTLADELSTLLGLSTGKGAIPASVLAKAPHLAKLSAPVASDPHLEKTQELLSVFSPQNVQDTLVNRAQFAPVRDPLPQTFWRKILLDSYIDFEKLFASMDKGYDHRDDPKDFGAGYALVKKDQAFSKRPLRTEADWIRVFGAWSSGVAFFFPHREAELREYQTIVMDLFRAAPANPLVAISFDVQVRDKYSRKPFHLDDRAQLNSPLLAQMLSPGSASVPRTNKRGPSSQPPSSGGNQKRADIPCRNWSFGTCKAEVCPNRRKHGTCFICGEGHRAKDNEQCAAALQSRS